MTEHGTHSSYVMGCRCAKCREGHRTAALLAGWNVRNGPRGDAKRRWDRENKSVCEFCGGPCARRCDQCAECRVRLDREARDLRRSDIAALWNKGLLLREIADRLGSTKNSIQVEVVRMRAAGYDLPYRYTMRDGKRVAA